MWRGILFSLLLMPWTDGEACQLAIRELEEALARSTLHLKSETTLHQSARISGRPLHLTSHITLPYIWLTNVNSGTDYALVRKSDTGFGFSQPSIQKFEFLKSDQMHLRSLDFNGLQNQVLASLVYEDPQTGTKSLILKAAGLEDISTGQLAARDGDPLVIEGIADAGENFVVSPRPGTSDFWVTDSSRSIYIVNLSEDGGLSHERIILPEIVHIKGEAKKLSQILKVQFLSDSKRAYIKFKTEDGQIYIAMLFLNSIHEGPSPSELLEKAGTLSSATPEQSYESYALDFDSAVAIAPGSLRSAVHPNLDLVFVAYENRIDVYNLKEKVDFHISLDTSKIAEGFELSGIEFYWEGEIVAGKDNSNPRYHGEVKAVLLLWDPIRSETRIHWVSIGKPQKL